MLFDSYLFILCFLPVVLLVFFACSPRLHLQSAWIVIASLFFYSWWNSTYLFLIIGSIAANYLLSKTIYDNLHNRHNKHLLVLGLTFNLGLLGFFKYTNFFVETANNTLGTHWFIPTITLPLALSFFTFQQIAYLVDMSKGKVKNSTFLQYCFFICFFPQLIAGPIVHHQEIIPQLNRRYFRYFNIKNLSIGLTVFSMGLVKKLGLADSIAPFANAVFDNPSDLTFFEAWSGAFAYTFQLYFDFSGYSDMAIGLARMFNVRLPQNFNSPYQATNIIDFWRRWHMTLSRFLRDYLYIPLGGNKKGVFRRHVNLMITMLLGGLWHGASWTFVFWGGLHGAYLIINHIWKQMPSAMKQIKGYSQACWLITFLAVVIAWVPFRANDFHSTNLILSSMFDPSTIKLPSFLASIPLVNWLGISPGGMFANNLADWRLGIPLIGALALISLTLKNTDEWLTSKSNAGFLIWKPSTSWAALTGATIVLCLFLMSNESEFIYFQF